MWVNFWEIIADDRFMVSWINSVFCILYVYSTLCHILSIIVMIKDH